MCKSNALGSIWDVRFGQNAAHRRTCILPFVVDVFVVVVDVFIVVVVVVVGGVHIRITIAAALPSRGDESSGGVGAIVPRARFCSGGHGARPRNSSRHPSSSPSIDERSTNPPPRGAPGAFPPPSPREPPDDDGQRRGDGRRRGTGTGTGAPLIRNRASRDARRRRRLRRRRGWGRLRPAAAVDPPALRRGGWPR